MASPSSSDDDEETLAPSSSDRHSNPPESSAGEGSEAPAMSEADEQEEEEEAECGFCLFMKGGGCKESFVAWEKCVEDAEKTGEDVVEKCFEVTSLLKKCMDAHSDYYEPVLRAEQAMADAVAAEAQELAAEPQMPPESQN